MEDQHKLDLIKKTISIKFLYHQNFLIKENLKQINKINLTLKHFKIQKTI